jgi:hypothetical protein
LLRSVVLSSDRDIGQKFAKACYSDFPLWDLLFGTFREGDGFMPAAGFDTAATGLWLDMAPLRDVHRPDFRLGQDPRDVVHST